MAGPVSGTVGTSPDINRLPLRKKDFIKAQIIKRFYFPILGVQSCVCVSVSRKAQLGFNGEPFNSECAVHGLQTQ